MQKFGYILLVGLLGLSWAHFGHGKSHGLHRKVHEKFAHVLPGSGGGSDGGAVCIPPTCCNERAPCPPKDQPNLKFCMGNSATQNGHCVECIGDANCQDGAKCVGYACVQSHPVPSDVTCTTDADCVQTEYPYCCLPSEYMWCTPHHKCVSWYNKCYGPKVHIPCHRVPLP